MIKKSCLLFSTLVLLSGCAASPPPPVSTTVIEKPAVKRQVSQLETAGMQIIQQGDRLTIIIPTDVYFEPRTTSIKDEQKANLVKMALFVKNFTDSYPNSVVRVTGYTDHVFSQRNQLELSQSYASAVSSYLFNAGIEPRRIATQSRGNNEPIAAETPPSSSALNRRVVVQVN